ncbi:MGMT family protein [Acidilobus sp.]|jgi:methylated-DNA-[protein]-cysteine S-methyltransferase|uniref:MGMT family protein n=1 Tax=Acidilobus sp. TaxID=1872109 RepID=UPI003D063726
MNSLDERVYEVVKAIPRGKATTYKAIAELLGVSPRAVARALKRNPRPIEVPCHRVIMSDRSLGGYAFGGPEVKRMLLLSEGVRFDEEGKVLEEFIVRDLRSIDKNLWVTSHNM